MPPKPKFTRAEIVNAAFEIARETGIDSVAARTLGARLGATTSPIFTFFSNMEELKRAVYEKAKYICLDYLRGCLDFTPAFKEFGLRYVRFAVEEPHLYHLLFSSHPRYATLAGDMMAEYSELTDQLLPDIRAQFSLTAEDAAELFQHMLTYVAGIIVSISNGYCTFSEINIAQQMGTACLGTVFLLKARNGALDLASAHTMANSVGILPLRTQKSAPDQPIGSDKIFILK